MNYETFIQSCIQAIWTGSLTQKMVRQSQEFSLNMDDARHNQDLTKELQSSLVHILALDAYKGHLAISLLVEGNSHIRTTLTSCCYHCLNSIQSSLKMQADSFNEKYYQISVKALYGLLQYCLSPSHITSEIMEKLEDILDELKKFINSDNLIRDIALISSSSIILIISLINPNPVDCFNQFLDESASNLLDKECDGNPISISLTSDIDPISEDSAGTLNSKGHWNSFNIPDPKPCYPNLVLIHGILNVNPAWLICMEKPKEDTSIDYPVSGSLQILINSLFMKLWTSIQKHCITSVSYSQQVIQVLLHWLQLFHIFIKGSSQINQDWKKSKIGVGKAVDMNKDSPAQPLQKNSCMLCSDLHMKPLFSLEQTNFGQIIQVLNFLFENQNKGILPMMLQCYKELLHLHDYFLPNHSILSMEKILQSILSSDMLSSRVSFLHLQMALEILSPQKVLSHHPSIPHTMCLGLKTNQFAALVTSIFRSLTNKLSSDEWLLHFEPVHQYCIEAEEDRILWQSYKTLWLPVIADKHPVVVVHLVKSSVSGHHELEAKITLLRLCRLKGIMNIVECIPRTSSFLQITGNDYLCDFDHLKCQFQVVCCQYVDSSDCGDVGQREWPNIESSLLNGLIHVNDNIRAEAFAVLCVTQKTTTPLSGVEVILARKFLTHNLNTDSQSFRQSILKSFRSLVCRIRDSCYQEAKKMQKFFANPNLNLLEESSSEELLITIDILMWLIHKCHDDFSLLGNYSRHSTALQLYWILLDVFYDISTFTQNDVESKKWDKYIFICQLLHLLSRLRSNQESLVISMDLTLHKTSSVLLACCIHEMNDIRHKASELLLSIHWIRENFYPRNKVYFGNQQTCDTSESLSLLQDQCRKQWFSFALGLLDSAKASEMESGVILTRLLLDTSPDPSVFLHLFRKDSLHETEFPTSGDVFEAIIDAFIRRIEAQFDAAQRNVLLSAQTSPISGTVLVLTTCLTECHPRLTSRLTPKFVGAALSRLSVLYCEMAQFIIASLAICSSGRSGGPPSFSEMGMSIDALIDRCQAGKSTSADGSSPGETSQQRSGASVNEENLIEETCEAMTSNQQVVLSFFWHLLKMCCWSSAKLTEAFPSCLEEAVTHCFLVDLVVFVLTGTRHKGAMESARDALALMTRCLFENRQTASVEIIEKQLWVILDDLAEPSPSSRRTSTTRRAAGLSMLFAAICSSVPAPRQDRLVAGVIYKLVSIAQAQVDVRPDFGEVDLSRAVSLHILQSLVLNARLAFATLPHLPSISGLCLQNFSSDIWSVRNAALQLFGAVVPRLLGQKKVKEDTASWNCITAVEFCYKNPSLTTAILKLLRESSCYLDDETSNPTSPSLRFGSLEILNHPCLVPVLSLLARLNPGTAIQQNDTIKSLLDALIGALFTFVYSPVFTVRRLAASALATLSSYSEVSAKRSLEAVLDCLVQGVLPDKSNCIHGCLLFISKAFTLYPDVFEKYFDLENVLVARLKELVIGNPSVLNQALILDVLNQVSPQSVVNLTASVGKYIETSKWGFQAPQAGYFHPGSSIFKRTMLRGYLAQEKVEEYSRFFLSNDQDIREEAFLFLTQQLKDFPEQSRFSELQNRLWEVLENQSLQTISRNRVKFSQIFYLLSSLLRTHPLSVGVAKGSCPLLEELLTEDWSPKSVVVIVAYMVADDEARKYTGNLALVWARVVYKLTSPSVNEDWRISAGQAISICLEKAFRSPLSRIDFVYPLIKASFNLLQDEDKAVRLNSFSTMQNLGNVTSFVASIFLINRVLKLITPHNIFDCIYLLWDLCFEYSLQLLWSHPSSEDSSTPIIKYLFESPTDNPYREPQQLSDIVCSLMENLAETFYYPTSELNLDSKLRIQHFADAKIADLCTINKALPRLLDPCKLCCWIIILRLVIVKNGLRFLNCLKKIWDLNYDESFKILSDAPLLN